MSELTYIPFEEEAEDIKDKVVDYWTVRAEGFLKQRQHELDSPKARKWLLEINNKLKMVSSAGKEGLKILDIGCGAGFFTVLLGKEGHSVTGIDLTPEMIEKAGELMEERGPYRGTVTAMCMDAEKPDFEDESFDVIITRNLTWTLPHPIDAYSEWFRVLKPGGILLNFDAEYAKGEHHLGCHENCAHIGLDDEMNEKCHRIYHMLTISTLERPRWDMDVLKGIGFRYVDPDCSFGDRMFDCKDEFYIPDRMFMITAVK